MTKSPAVRACQPTEKVSARFYRHNDVLFTLFLLDHGQLSGVDPTVRIQDVQRVQGGGNGGRGGGPSARRQGRHQGNEASKMASCPFFFGWLVTKCARWSAWLWSLRCSRLSGKTPLRCDGP